ncbi:MAG: hypothetical protein HY554_00650 [Elusimicrobia bacterium]|nr:hypothetical protein [Elusimicrobiota bacterium]
MKREPGAPQPQPAPKAKAEAKDERPAPREVRLEGEPPAAKPVERAPSSGEPGVARERLPETPKHESRYRANARHEAGPARKLPRPEAKAHGKAAGNDLRKADPEAAALTRASAAAPRHARERLPEAPRHLSRYDAASRHEPGAAEKLPRPQARARAKPSDDGATPELGIRAPAAEKLVRRALAAEPELARARLPEPPKGSARYEAGSRHSPGAAEKLSRPRAQAQAAADAAGARLEPAAPELKPAARSAKAGAPAQDAARLPPAPKPSREALAGRVHEAGPARQAERARAEPLALAAAKERHAGERAPDWTAAGRRAAGAAPRLPKAALPAPPRSEGGVRERVVHPAQPVALARPAPERRREPRAAVESRIEAAAPQEPRYASHVAASPKEPLESLPQAPKSAVLPSYEHTAQSAALARPEPPPGPGTATEAVAGERSAAVRSSALEGRRPESRRGASTAPRLARISNVPEGRKVAANLPPLALTRRAALSVVTEKGNAVRSPERSGVVIPEGAVATGLPVTVAVEERVAEPELERRERAAQRNAVEPLGEPVSYGPEGTRFARPVTLELAYRRESLPPGVAEDRLTVHYWNPRVGDWESLPSTVDRQAQIVRAVTSHFSTYQIMSGPGLAATGGSGGDVLREAFAYPNPAGPGQTPRVRVESAADRVEIRVFDVSGELKASAAYDQPSAVLEHALDGANLGSGVYLYMVTGRRQGAAPVTVKGKLGVIR